MQKTTSKDGTTIAYDKTGQGPVIVVVLGALNSRKTGAKLAKALAPDFTVVNYDRRGRGDSTDTAPYDTEREVEDLAAVINDVGGPVFLYGHSSGGALALTAAAKLAKQVKKLAIYEVPYSLDDAARQSAKKYAASLKKLLAGGKKGDAVALFVGHVGVTEKQIAAMKKMPMWRGLEKLAPTLAYDSQVLGEGHGLPARHLAGIKVPSLVMHGGKGAPSMRDAAQAISQAIPKAQFLTLEGQTHGVSPKALAPVLRDFFK
jgi:pimeloyl-ACP methyl ester carboxylesterase